MISRIGKRVGSFSSSVSSLDVAPASAAVAVTNVEANSCPLVGQTVRARLPCGGGGAGSTTTMTETDDVLASSLLKIADENAEGSRIQQQQQQQPQLQRIEEINPAWLRSVCPNLQRVNKIHVVSEEELEGRTSHHCILNLYHAKTAAEIGRPLATMMLKFMRPADSDPNKSPARLLFARECCFYEVLNLIPGGLSTPVAPLCHHSDAAAGVLLLEELPLSYAQFAPRLRTRTRNRDTGEVVEIVQDLLQDNTLDRIATSLAILHTAFARAPASLRKFILQSLCDPSIFRDAFLKSLLPARGCNTELLLLDDIFQLERFCLVHGNLNHAGHVLLCRDFPATPARLVDWKRAGFAPPELDLLHVFMSLERRTPVRVPLLDKFLGAYISSVSILLQGSGECVAEELSVNGLTERLLVLAQAIAAGSDSESPVMQWVNSSSDDDKSEILSAVQDLKTAIAVSQMDPVDAEEEL